MDYINMVELIDELNTVLREGDATPQSPAAATRASEAPVGATERRLFDDLFAFDNADLLRLVESRRDATAVELHLADRHASALEALEELESVLRIDQSCPVTRKARRAVLH